jgi:hypothetical protein
MVERVRQSLPDRFFARVNGHEVLTRLRPGLRQISRGELLNDSSYLLRDRGWHCQEEMTNCASPFH